MYAELPFVIPVMPMTRQGGVAVPVDHPVPAGKVSTEVTAHALREGAKTFSTGSTLGTDSRRFFLLLLNFRWVWTLGRSLESHGLDPAILVWIP